MKMLIGLILGCVAMGSSAMAEEQIINNTSAKCLDTTGRAANGAIVRMWNCTNHPNQLWDIINVSGGYRLKNKASGFCLDTTGQAANGAIVRMWNCTNHPNQLWYLIKINGNRFRFRNKASGFCLDTANGNAVRMWGCANHPNQQWMRSIIQ